MVVVCFENFEDNIVRDFLFFGLIQTSATSQQGSYISCQDPPTLSYQSKFFNVYFTAHQLQKN